MLGQGKTEGARMILKALSRFFVGADAFDRTHINKVKTYNNVDVRVQCAIVVDAQPVASPAIQINECSSYNKLSQSKEDINI